MKINKETRERVGALTIPLRPDVYENGVPLNFIPWEVDLSPSALYTCSVTCRKLLGHKTPELKWISVKRWVTLTPAGVTLPPGCYLSIKRRESFEAIPRPKFVKQDYILLLMPYGTVFFGDGEGRPLSEPDIWLQTGSGRTYFEEMLEKDINNPLPGYFKTCHTYFANNPEQVGIHLKRKKSTTE
jgi:hypothetical protein